MLELVHYIHVVAAAIFVGAVIFFDWVIGMAMLKMTPAERLRLSTVARTYAIPVIMGSLILTIAAGITRLLVSGAVEGWGDLATGYGLRAMLAIVTIIVAEAIASPMRNRMMQGVKDEDDALFATWFKRQRWITLVMVLIVLYLMVAMRMGLY